MKPVRIDKPILWAALSCLFAGFCWLFASRAIAAWAFVSGFSSGFSFCFAAGYAIMWIEQARAGRPS